MSDIINQDNWRKIAILLSIFCSAAVSFSGHDHVWLFLLVAWVLYISESEKEDAIASDDEDEDEDEDEDDEVPLNFIIDWEQQERIQAWLKSEVYPDVIAKQKAEPNPSPVAQACWNEGYPYGGACGGGITYQFSPTGIGVVTHVIAYDKRLDLTDYESW